MSEQDPYTDKTRHLNPSETGESAADRLRRIREKNRVRTTPQHAPQPAAQPAPVYTRSQSRYSSSSGMRRGGVLILLIGLILIVGGISLFLFLMVNGGQVQVLANQSFALAPGQEMVVHTTIAGVRPVTVRFGTDGDISTNGNCRLEQSGDDAILMCPANRSEVAILSFPGFYLREKASEPLQGRMYGFQGTIYLE